MNIPINQNFVNSLKNSEGSLKVTLKDIKSIIKFLENDACKIIVLNKNCFVVFREISDVEFIVTDFGRLKDIDFLNNKGNDVVDASAKNGNYGKFIFNEFFQGASFWGRFFRFLNIGVIIIVLNAVTIMYGEMKGVNNVFSGLLAAVSIFVAIFSLFVTSHDYMTRKRLQLFESAQLSYYFSIDKYITQTGIYAIILSILALILTSGQTDNQPVYGNGLENILVIVTLNITFVAVVIILRSMVEFYIVRPGKFMLSDLKKASFDSYRKKR